MNKALTTLALIATTALGACASSGEHTQAPSAGMGQTAQLSPQRQHLAKRCMLIKRDRPSATCDSFNRRQNELMDQVMALYHRTNGDKNRLTEREKQSIMHMEAELARLESRS